MTRIHRSATILTLVIVGSSESAACGSESYREQTSTTAARPSSSSSAATTTSVGGHGVIGAIDGAEPGTPLWIWERDGTEAMFVGPAESRAFVKAYLQA